MCVLGFVGAGVLGAFNARDWSTIADSTVIKDIDRYLTNTQLQDIRLLIAATSVSTVCLMCTSH